MTASLHFKIAIYLLKTMHTCQTISHHFYHIYPTYSDSADPDQTAPITQDERRYQDSIFLISAGKHVVGTH